MTGLFAHWTFSRKVLIKVLLKDFKLRECVCVAGSAMFDQLADHQQTINAGAKMAKVSKDLPIAEITLRKYEKPFNLKGRDLVKKLCLSIGLLHPGDSRDVVVDVFSVILNSDKPLSSRDVEDKVIFQRKSLDLPMFGITPPNIRRQIKRLRDLFLVERTGNEYKITEDQQLEEIFIEKIEQYYLRSITDRVKEYCRAVKKG